MSSGGWSWCDTCYNHTKFTVNHDSSRTTRLSSQAATILSSPVSFMNYGLLLSFHRDDIVFDLFVFSICCCFF